MRSSLNVVALVAIGVLTAATSHASSIVYNAGLYDSPLLIPTFDPPSLNPQPAA